MINNLGSHFLIMIVGSIDPFSIICQIYVNLSACLMTNDKL